MSIAQYGDSTARTRRYRAIPPISAVIAVIVLVFVAVCAVFGAAIAPYNPNALDLTHVAARPSLDHLLGTDQLGRDVLSRVMVGARTPVVGGLAIATGIALIGSVVGIYAGYRRGVRETLIMRGVDVMIALPGLLVAIVVVSVLGGSYILAVVFLTIFLAPFEVRMQRGLTLKQRTLPYVEAAETLGLSSVRIMARHIWPNTLPVVVADFFLNFAFGLVALSTLSFLGLGVSLGTPDWGRMLFEAKQIIFDNPWAAIAPAALIAGTAASFAIIGDLLFERMTDHGRTSDSG